MHVRSILLAAAVALAGLAVVPAAHADDADASTIEVLGIDTTTPGHALVTIETSAKVVRVQVATETHSVNDAFASVPDTGRVVVDVETWGMAGPNELYAEPCAFAADYGCDSASTVRQDFVATDVVPDVTWDGKTQIHAADPTYTVDLAGELGDSGTLFVNVLGERRPVSELGANTVELDYLNGIGPVSLDRCSRDMLECRTLVTSPQQVEARIWMYVALDGTLDGPVSPRPDHPVDLPVTVHAEPGDYVLDWWLRGVDGSGESGIPIAVDESSPQESVGGDLSVGEVQVPIHLTSSPTGNQHVQVRLTRQYDGFGPVVGTSDKSQGALLVDVTPPEVSMKVSWGAFYPHHDGYRDQIGISVQTDAWHNRLDVLDRAGSVIRTYTVKEPDHVFGWKGDLAGGADAPPGRYTFRLTSTDDLGNTTVRESDPVQLSDKRLVSRTLHRTVSPVASMVDSAVGSCADLIRPASRGWKGSIELSSDAHCARPKEWVVGTTHALRVPAALRYGTLRVTVEGGAARTRPGSYLFLDQYQTDSGWGDGDSRLSFHLGSHPGPARHGDRYINDRRTTYWAVYTSGSAQYDVRRFVVDLRYDVLR